VHQVISTYNRLGPAAMEMPGKGGRHHQYLTLQEEQALVKSAKGGSCPLWVLVAKSIFTLGMNARKFIMSIVFDFATSTTLGV
jgi:hypothetical protein